ncbi:glycosyltransferase [Paracoccus sediminis]|uniref:Glycosyltransferase like family 2 n=1 Tax=Paracoccus sediminis TaxID=1214787 RepID=A0A238Y6S9_9RHOB|nr:glycosyltransferase [Paracoccus sediminis]SNR66720.1 Glycosyltransferase like family 2 [Paracoccus sediminis]
MTALDIGIFAHDEAALIGALIGDLARQDLIRDPAADLRILVLANGCTDDTVARARAAVDALSDPAVRSRFQVLDLPQPGKSRTAHRFIHDLSRPEAEVLGFLDGDVHLPQPDTLARMLAMLDERPGLRVVTSRPVKDVIHFDRPAGAMARLIAAGGDGLSDWRKSICGQLFMMRAAPARRIALPAGLPVEDGFIRAMALTDLLSGPQDLDRIDGDPAVFHVYESIRGLGPLIRHQTRIVIGSAVNAALFAHIRRNAPTEERAHALLMRAADDPQWLGRVLKTELPRAPHGYVPFDFLVKRLRRGGRPGVKGKAMLAAGFGLDLLVWLRASLRMAFRPSAGFW